MKKYLGYIRVSKKDHENSLPTQRPIVEDYARRRGLDLVKIYEEKKSAFGKVDRQMFRQMIEHLRRPEIAGVIFHKVDRSARNMPDFVLLQSFFGQKDIRVIEGEFDTTKSHGRLQFRLFCDMAVWYSENLSEEVTTKMANCLRLGYYPSVSYFGYRKGRRPNTETGEPGDPDPKLKYPDHNARHVREMYELYDSGNYSFRKIARLMNEKGVRNAGGGKLTKGMVERILSNEFYRGVIVWGRTRQKEPARYVGKHRPLVSDELFERVKARREGRTRSKGGFGRHAYSRLFRCGCDSLLYPETPTARNGSRAYSYLRCPNSGCDFSSISVDAMEDRLVEKLMGYHIRPGFFRAYQDAMRGMSDMIAAENESQRKSVSLRLSQIEAEMGRVREGFVKGLFESQEAARLRQTLEEEKSALLRRLDAEGRALDGAYFKTAQKFLETFQIIAQKYKNAPADVKREVCDLFFTKRTYAGGKLILEPSPIMREVADVAELSDGRGDSPNAETLKRLRASIARLAVLFYRQDLTVAITRLTDTFLPQLAVPTSTEPDP
jgi:site-specific DNA recombinase